MPQNKVNAKSFATDVKAGVADSELMDKYKISSNAVLNNLFKKLIKNNLITQEELDNRHKAKFEVHEISKPEVTITPKQNKTQSEKRTEIKTNPSSGNKFMKVLKRALRINRYKIVGGSFGIGGDLIVENGAFSVQSSKKANFDSEDIQDIVLNEGEEQKKTGCLSIIVGIILTGILTLLFNIFGLAIGILLTVIGSQYTEKKEDTATVLLKNGKKIAVVGKLDKLLAHF